MIDKLNKILQIGLISILVISLFLFVLFFMNGESMTGTVLTWAYILVVITFVLLLGFPIIHIIRDPKSGKQALIGIAGFVVLFGICYALASDSVSADFYEKAKITPSISKIIGGALIMTYILFALSILSLILSSIGKLFK